LAQRVPARVVARGYLIVIRSRRLPSTVVWLGDKIRRTGLRITLFLLVRDATPDGVGLVE
jgi:hypothetical protein